MLLYLANDVCQQCRARKREEFLREFGAAMPSALEEAVPTMTPELQAKVRRVVDVWRQRSIFEPDTLKAIEARVRTTGKGSSATSSGTNGGTSGTSSGESTQQELSKELYVLRDKYMACQGSATTSSRLAALAVNVKYPAVFEKKADASQNELQDLREVLKKASMALAATIELRKATIGELQYILDVQKALLVSEEKMASDVQQKLDSVAASDSDEEAKLAAARPAIEEDEEHSLDAVDPEKTGHTETNANAPSTAAVNTLPEDSLAHLATLDPEIQALLEQPKS